MQQPVARTLRTLDAERVQRPTNRCVYNGYTPTSLFALFPFCLRHFTSLTSPIYSLTLSSISQWTTLHTHILMYTRTSVFKLTHISVTRQSSWNRTRLFSRTMHQILSTLCANLHHVRTKTFEVSIIWGPWILSMLQLDAGSRLMTHKPRDGDSLLAESSIKLFLSHNFSSFHYIYKVSLDCLYRKVFHRQYIMKS